MPTLVIKLHRLAGQYGPGEPKKRHVRAPKRAVNGKKPEPGGGQPESMAVGMRHDFRSLFGRRIKGGRVVCRKHLRGGQRRAAAIDSTGGCIHKMPCVQLAGELQQIQKRRKIALSAGIGLADGIAHPCLGGKMHHLVKVAPGQPPELPLRRIQPVKLKVSGAFCQPVQPRLLEARVIIVIQIVHPDNPFALLQQPLSKGGADKSGSACNQNAAHGPPSGRRPVSASFCSTFSAAAAGERARVSSTRSGFSGTS